MGRDQQAAETLNTAAISAATGAIRDLHDVSHSLGALDTRVATIAQRALALLRAGTTLSEIIRSAHGASPHS